jgi:hypothetical protein
VVQIDLPPLVPHNVMTTWALPKKKIAQLRGDHDARWPMFEKAVNESWQALVSSSSTTIALSQPSCASGRVPLD